MALETRSGRPASQNEFELRSFIDLLLARRVRRYLEVGVRHGDTFFEVMTNLPAGAKGVAVDLPGAMWGKTESRSSLEDACSDLRRRGYDATAIFGNSMDKATIGRVADEGPYDAVFIDGDHRYFGVKKDWENYRGCAPLIAFHDIAGWSQHERVYGNKVEVPILWAEIKEAHETVDLVDSGSRMGIGVVFL